MVRPVEADGGKWKRARQPFKFVTAGREREAIIAARDLSVTYHCRYLSQRPRRATNTPIHYLLSFLFTSIKYITAATRPAFTRTPRWLGALDTDSAVTTAYTNYHHGRHHRPW